MKIVLLTGAQKSQKTTTIEMVYQNLIQGMQNPPPKKQLPYGTNDFECVLPHPKGDVAIFSLGDTLDRMYEAIIKYSNVHCLIMAHSQIGGSVMMGFLACVSQFPQHVVIKKTNNNLIDCHTIINRI